MNSYIVSGFPRHSEDVVCLLPPRFICLLGSNLFWPTDSVLVTLIWSIYITKLCRGNCDSS